MAHEPQANPFFLDGFQKTTKELPEEGQESIQIVL